jgi:predicted nucleic acid-binding protein
MPDSTPDWVCVDASIIVPIFTQPPERSAAVSAWRRWHEAGLSPAAPSLLFYEVANVLRRYVHHGLMLPAEADDALTAALGLGVRLFGDPQLHQRALSMANELQLPDAYDAHYLALAEHLGAELWTGDRKLHRAVAQRLSWVRLLED